MRQERRRTADRARLALDVEQRDVAFGRGVELEDARDAEARLELAPHVEAEPVAAGEPQLVRALERMRRGLHEIAAQLADILEQGTVPAHHVVPEFPRGEFLTHEHRAA